VSPAVLPPWWEEFPGRLERELAAFRELNLEFVVDEAERARGRIVLAGKYRLASGKEIPLKVVYPDTYPRTRFVAYATDRADRVSAHQNPVEGNLCLLPRGSIHWDPAMLAARVLADRIELIYAPGGVPRELEDAQGEPVTSYLPCVPYAGVVVDEACFEVPADASHGRLRLVVDGEDWLRASPTDASAPIGKALVIEVRDSTGTALAVADDAVRAAFTGAGIAGVWERIDPAPDARHVEDVLERLRSLISRTPAKVWTTRGDHRFLFAGVLLREQGRRGRTNPAWAFHLARQRARGGPIELMPLRALRYGRDARGERIPELAPLRKATVSVIGLGSLGAPLTMTLARSGVASLRLADFDQVEPAGGVRWLSDLEGAGADKTAALQALLLRSYPLTKVEAFDLAVGRASLAGRQPSESSVLEAWAEGASLLVDATAEDDVSRVVSAYGDRLGIPQLYLWSLDGFGGVVVRVVPGKTGCFHCAQLHLSSEKGTIQGTPYAAPSDRRRVQPLGCADATFTGDAPSLTPIADHAARVAFGILCASAEGGYPAYRDDLFVLKLREPDGALVTPQWGSYALPRHRECTLCNR
jgi:hypothetical protein